MSGDVADITPGSNPVALARDMLRDAPEALAGAYVLVKENGDVLYDMAGSQRAIVLWGLQRMIHHLMMDEGQT